MSGAGTASPGSRILVVRLGAMGDIVHTLPAVASLKHSFPGSRLTWAVAPRWAPLLEGNPFVDRVALVRRAGPLEIWRSYCELRSENYDFVVDFQGLVKSALVASAVRPERIFGFHQSQIRERVAALCYSHKCQSCSAHVVERNLDLAATAGAASLLRTFPLPPGAPVPGLPAGGFVLASPGSGWKGKQWPPEYFTALAEMLRRDIGLRLVLNGPPMQVNRSQEPAAADPGIVRSETDISGLIYSTRLATAVVGVDSGPLHLAAALGKPGVAIYGPTDPSRNGPYGDSFTVLRHPQAGTTYKRSSSIDPWMREITPDEVFGALKAHLTRRQDSAGLLV